MLAFFSRQELDMLQCRKNFKLLNIFQDPFPLNWPWAMANMGVDRSINCSVNIIENTIIFQTFISEK